MLALLDAEDDGGLGEEGVLLAKVARGVEAQRPARGPLDVGEDVLEGVDGDLAGLGLGAVGQPGLDAAVVVGHGLEALDVAVGVGREEGRVGRRRRGWALEAHADALGWAAGRGVQDVAGDGVLVGHFGGLHGGGKGYRVSRGARGIDD